MLFLSYFMVGWLVGILGVLVGVLGVFVGLLGVLVGLLGILVGVLDLLFGVLGFYLAYLVFLFGVFGVLAGVLAFYLAYLFLKKVHRLEKSTLPPVVAVVTNIRYDVTHICAFILAYFLRGSQHLIISSREMVKDI